MKSNEYYGRLSTCHNGVIIKEVKTLIMENHCLILWEIGDELGISKDSAHVILAQYLGMCRISADYFLRSRNKFVLTLLSICYKLQQQPFILMRLFFPVYWG